MYQETQFTEDLQNPTTLLAQIKKLSASVTLSLSVIIFLNCYNTPHFIISFKMPNIRLHFMCVIHFRFDQLIK